MSRLPELRAALEARTARLGVVGLGYVGLAVAVVLAEAGFRVTGVDVKADRVALINRGQNPIEGDEPGLAEALAREVGAGRLAATTTYADLGVADVVLVAVETPVAADYRPRFEALRSACAALGPVLKPGALVIVESTLAPGTVGRVVVPLLEAHTGRRLNEGFYVGHCPERVMPGRLLRNLRSLSRVCGGSTPETAQTMVALYRTFVQADLDPADVVTAELVKTAENTFRDVNIAFANELALVCEAAGADFLRVRELVNKSPGRNVLLAGAGVGGHCIPKDPWLLAFGAQDQVPLRLVPAARAVNDGMPAHVAGLLRQGLAQHGRALAGARVAVLGYAYLEDSDDARNSPSAALVTALEQAGAEAVIHDPYVPGCERSWERAIGEADGVVVMVAHAAYRDLDLACLRQRLRTPVLVDGRRVFDPQAARAAGLSYSAVGLGRAETAGTDSSTGPVEPPGPATQQRGLQQLTTPAAPGGQGRAVLASLPRLGLAGWVAAVMGIYLVLFGPPEFWSVAQRFGVYDWLQRFQGWLQAWLTAGYQS